MSDEQHTSAPKDGECLTVSQALDIPIRCAFCGDEIGDHFVQCCGETFCSQGCMRGAQG